MLNNQANIISGTILELYPNNTARIKYEVSTITGETSNPLKPDKPKELEVVASINRTFVTSTSLFYRSIDPMAVYLPGDRVAVYEMWQKFPGEPITYSFHVIGAWRVLDPPTAGPTVNI